MQPAVCLLNRSIGRIRFHRSKNESSVVPLILFNLKSISFKHSSSPISSGI
jgi:hypothetical protein